MTMKSIVYVPIFFALRVSAVTGEIPNACLKPFMAREVRRTRLSRFKVAASLLALLILLQFCLIKTTRAVAGSALAAWVELVGPGSEVRIRAIVPAEADCPTINADGDLIPMDPRPEPAAHFFSKRDKNPRPKFDVRTCQHSAPVGKLNVTLDGSPLPLPPGEPQRVVVFGDTGCRIKGGPRHHQDCESDWKYPEIAKRAAESHPDLVIHVGDYLYREYCYGDAVFCHKWRTGYDWEIWNADFFEPSRPLLATAPWIFVRGNHETCRRAGEGWFRFLDHEDSLPDTCERPKSSFFTVNLGDFGFIVIDSAEIAHDDQKQELPSDEQTTEFASQYPESSKLPSQTWILSHAPFNGAIGSQVSDSMQQGALGKLLSDRIKLILSGHIHAFEAISFETDRSPRPPQLIVGTGGTQLDNASVATLSINGALVQSAVTVVSAAYMVWDRNGAKWSGSLNSETGKVLALCELEDRSLRCNKQ